MLHSAPSVNRTEYVYWKPEKTIPENSDHPRRESSIYEINWRKMREVLKSQDISSLLKVSEPCARRGLGVSGYVHCKSPRRVCGEQFPKLSRNFLPTTFFFFGATINQCHENSCRKTDIFEFNSIIKVVFMVLNNAHPTLQSYQLLGGSKCTL